MSLRWTGHSPPDPYSVIPSSTVPTFSNVSSSPLIHRRLSTIVGNDPHHHLLQSLRRKSLQNRTHSDLPTRCWPVRLPSSSLYHKINFRVSTSCVGPFKIFELRRVRRRSCNLPSRLSSVTSGPVLISLAPRRLPKVPPLPQRSRSVRGTLLEVVWVLTWVVEGDLEKRRTERIKPLPLSMSSVFGPSVGVILKTGPGETRKVGWL